MTKSNKHRLLNLVAVVLLLWGLFALSDATCNSMEYHVRKKGIDFLTTFCDTIVLKLRGTLNNADDLSLAIALDDGRENFDAASRKLMDNDPNIIYTELFDNRKLVRVYPKGSPRQRSLGLTFKDLDSAYSLALLRQKLVIEGPTVQNGKSVFLAIRPLPSTLGVVYGTEIGVAIDSAAVLEELNLQALTDRGYEYELWRMRPIDGSKQPIAISSKEVDFSDAATVSFEMPSRWTLSIVPKNGWYPKHLMLALCLGDVAIVLCFAAMLHLYHKRCELLHAKAISESVDAETGLPNRGELLRRLAEWTKHPEKPFVLIYIVIDKYNRFEQTAAPEQKRELLAHMLDCMNEYIKGEHISARIGDRNFVLALREDLSPADIDNIQKGLAIEMIWKYMIDGKKFFLSVRSTARWFPSDASNPEELLTMTISDYFSQKENASEIK